MAPPSARLAVDPFLGRFRAQRGGGEPPVYALKEPNPRIRHWAVELNGREVYRSRHPSHVVSYLRWQVLQQAIGASRRFLIVHAGVVSLTGRALLLPGPSGAGKTTLVAGLVAAGFSYLSDEAAAIDPLDGKVIPVPLALSVKPGSRETLASLGASVPQGAGASEDSTFAVAPELLRPHPVGSTAPVHRVVFPDYGRGRNASLAQLTRAQGLLELSENCFNLDLFGSSGFRVLADLAKGCTFHRLGYGLLPAAVETLQSLMEDSPTRREADSARATFSTPATR
ncbi:MAG: hypothetical protein ACRDHM_09325 [Actinomycetota bacterium]